jgi:hypothetical protein
MEGISMLTGTSLFIGVESQNWTLADFQTACSRAKSLGISALIVKIADGTNEWYGGIGGWQGILAVIRTAGLLPIPYIYSYGDKFSGLSGEIAILEWAMASAGIVVADMEAEWNGQTAWAQTLAKQLSSVPRLFAVTTWADPQLQDWQGVIQALKPRVNVWMPQVYSDYLASVYQAQFAGLNTVPVLSIDADFGPNAVIQHANNAKSCAIALWEYQAAIGACAQIVREIVAMNTTAPSANQQRAADDCWDSVLKTMISGPAPKGTGIYQAWLAALVTGQQYGPPLTHEYSSVDWSGNTITVQEFAHARCEWRNGMPNWYSTNGKI